MQIIIHALPLLLSFPMLRGMFEAYCCIGSRGAFAVKRERCDEHKDSTRRNMEAMPMLPSLLSPEARTPEQVACNIGHGGERRVVSTAPQFLSSSGETHHQPSVSASHIVDELLSRGVRLYSKCVLW